MTGPNGVLPEVKAVAPALGPHCTRSELNAVRNYSIKRRQLHLISSSQVSSLRQQHAPNTVKQSEGRGKEEGS